MSDAPEKWELRYKIARAIHEGLGESWAYSNYSGNEWVACRDMLDSAADAVLAAIGPVATPAEVAALRAERDQFIGLTREAEAEILRLMALFSAENAQVADLLVERDAAVQRADKADAVAAAVGEAGKLAVSMLRAEVERLRDVEKWARNYIYWATHNGFTDPENMLVCAEWDGLLAALARAALEAKP